MWCVRSSWPTRRPSAARCAGAPGCEGALHVDGARTVHTAGMKFPIDVAFLSTDLTVVRVARLKPWRVAMGGRTARSAVQTEAGSFERWGVRVGDQLEVREVRRTVQQAARRERGAAGPARAGGHADRQPGRSLAPGARGAGDGRPDLLRGHAPHPGPAVGARHLGQGPARRPPPVAARAQRGGPARPGGRRRGRRRDGGRRQRRRHARDLGPGRLAGGAAGRRRRDGQHRARPVVGRSARWW